MRNILILLAFAGVPAAAQETLGASGAVLRALDKISGTSRDVEINAGQAVNVGRLTVTLRECRYPATDPAGNAYASLEIAQSGKEGVLFSGWMIASSPALSALEHPRYDIWVMRCKTS